MEQIWCNTCNYCIKEHNQVYELKLYKEKSKLKIREDFYENSSPLGPITGCTSASNQIDIFIDICHIQLKEHVQGMCITYGQF